MQNFDSPPITNQQMLSAARLALFNAMQAQSVGSNDRHIQLADVAKLQATVDYWQEQVNAENGSGSNGGVVYAGFMPPM